MKIRGQRVIPMAERLTRLSRQDLVTGCWVWTGAVRSERWPYGRLMIGSRTAGTRRSRGAHQVSFETFIGPIADGLCVCHNCDNPRCINPNHLFLGTPKDNADDRDRKGRNKTAPRVERNRHPQAKLTEKQVAALCASPLSSRKIAAEYGVDPSHVRALRRAHKAAIEAMLSVLPVGGGLGSSVAESAVSLHGDTPDAEPSARPAPGWIETGASPVCAGCGVSVGEYHKGDCAILWGGSAAKSDSDGGH